MKLTYQQICDITQGVAYVSEEDGSVVFHRFTKEQEELYYKTNQCFYLNTDSEDREGLLRFAFWRTQMCREVEKKAKEISEALVKLL